MREDGDTASWLVEIFADGPKSEEEVATRLKCSGAGESDAVHLEATPFTRECAELWVATRRRRFLIAARDHETRRVRLQARSRCVGFSRGRGEV